MDLEMEPKLASLWCASTYKDDDEDAEARTKVGIWFVPRNQEIEDPRSSPEHF